MVISGERTILVKEDDLNVCNYLIPHGRQQNTYRVFVKPTDTVILEAIVDQNMENSIRPDIVQPSELINKP